MKSICLPFSSLAMVAEVSRLSKMYLSLLHHPVIQQALPNASAVSQGREATGTTENLPPGLDHQCP